MNADVSPFPPIYCPAGKAKPKHCGHVHGLRLARDVKGPDGKPGGMVYGAAYDPATQEHWARTQAGYYILFAGYKPQDCIRFNSTPRIQRWVIIAGSEENHFWRIPVLLTPVEKKQGKFGYESALDRIWTGKTFSDPKELVGILERLHAIIRGRLSDAKSVDERNMAVMALVTDILMLGYAVDGNDLAVSGWVTQSFQERVVQAACDRADLLVGEGAEDVS